MTKKRVLLALSGGVDSAVAGYLLLQQGYLVDGVFMRNWDATINNDMTQTKTNNNICPQEQDYMDAKAVAHKLGITLHRVDFVKEYWELVFSVFLEQLKLNLTPNPDILCNKEIKFNALLKYAINHGYDYLATGHYAKIKVKNKHKQLALAKDKAKDQTYFLAQLAPVQIMQVLFPLATVTKEQVRKIARNLDLAVASKKDSTGICFIGERQLPLFLANYLTSNPGNICLLDGTCVGYHQGLFNYTIGQRKGLGIGTIKNDKGPWFVVKKDAVNNILFITNNRQSPLLYSNKCFLTNLVWRMPLTKRSKIKVRFRHQGKLINAWINPNNPEVLTYKKARAITPGQYAVFYKKGICLGSGLITAVYQDECQRY